MKRLYIVAAILVCALAFSTAAVAKTQQSVAPVVQVASAEVSEGEKVAHELASEGEEVAKEIAAEEHAKEGEHHGLPWKNYMWRVINFVLFIGILVYAAGGKIKAFFVGRRSQIKDDLDNLQARQAEAEKKLKGVEQSIANLEQEKKAILDEAEQQGQALREAIIEKAKKDAEVLKDQAKRTAANEAKGALDDMRAEVAELVVAAAEKIVREKLSDAEHDKLVDEYLNKVVLN
ncbi:F0F1 ATP synthase subunit B [Salidesulfovibrio brasiliensis]|uniref:F0F1 ATP synthase subunit B n=1 Tax=Salidesulfovibrio brasiliensis TaxID=221711 RepID=UPI000AEE2A65|nr:F0F1 ATP synthase subunit B [Salidesulfovibrio brasiliensis]